MRLPPAEEIEFEVEHTRADAWKRIGRGVLVYALVLASMYAMLGVVRIAVHIGRGLLAAADASQAIAVLFAYRRFDHDLLLLGLSLVALAGWIVIRLRTGDSRTHYRVDVHGWRILARGEEHEGTWATTPPSLVESPRSFTWRLAPHSSHRIPKAAFRDPADLARFRWFARTAIGPDRRKHWRAVVGLAAMYIPLVGLVVEHEWDDPPRGAVIVPDDVERREGEGYRLLTSLRRARRDDRLSQPSPPPGRPFVSFGSERFRARIDALTQFQASIPDVRRHPEPESFDTGTWCAVAAVASPADVPLLLTHPFAIVRIHAARHLLTHEPVNLDGLYPLLADRGPIRVSSDCTSPGDSTVGLWLVDEVSARMAGRPELRDWLEHAALDTALPPRVRSWALHDAVDAGGTHTRAIALVLLEQDAIELQSAALDALATVGTIDDVDSIARFASHDDLQTRMAVANALALHASPTSLRVATRLLGDADRHVQAAAARAYARQPDADPARVDRLLTDPSDARPSIRDAAADGLALLGTPDAVARIEPFMMLSSGFLQSVLDPKRPGRSALATRLLRSVVPPRRMLAFDYLARAGTLADAPLLSSIAEDAGRHPGERIAAVRALGRLRDHAAIPQLLRVQHTTNGALARAANEALRRIRTGRIPEWEASRLRALAPADDMCSSDSAQ